MSYQSEVLADSPYLYWRLDESSGPTAADTSGNGRTGTYTNSPTFAQAGLITDGTSVDFTTTQYVRNGAVVNITDATLEVWFDYPGGTPGSGVEWFVAGLQDGPNSGVGDKQLFINESGLAAFYVYDGAGPTAIGTVPLSAGPHHLVGTIDATADELKLYVDGSQVGTTVTATTSYAGYSVANVFVAGPSAAIAGEIAVAGRRDEFALYTTALSSARIAAHYAAGIASLGQILSPSADSVDGAWTDQAGGTSLAAAIDESSASDADYIRSELNPSNSGCRVKLSAGGDPHISTDHVVHWRTGKIGSATINMTVKLYQGGGNSQGAGTLIASFSRNNVGSFTTYDETLSGGEADSITDYTDLYLEFFANTA